MSNDINDVLGISSSTQEEPANLNFKRKYPALRTLSGIISVIAWIVAAMTLIIVMVLLSNSRGEGSWLIPVGILAIGSILFIALLAYSEIIKVFVDIEANTRQIAMK